MMRLLTGTFFAAVCFGADFTGIWTGQLPGRNGGDPVDVAFKLEQKGTAITGKQYGDYRSSPIVEGSAAGDQAVFVVVASEQAGNQINETRIRYTAVFKDGGLEVTRQRESSTNAGNKGGVQSRGGDGRATLTLRRLGK
jgi:hypothetical protein